MNYFNVTKQHTELSHETFTLLRQNLTCAFQVNIPRNNTELNKMTARWPLQYAALEPKDQHHHRPLNLTKAARLNNDNSQQSLCLLLNQLR